MLRKDPFVTGEFYHVYNRGIDKRNIFKSTRDYERFMMLLCVANTNSGSLRLDNLINHEHKNFQEIMLLDKGQPLVSIFAWCLMTNHFHLLLRQEVDGGITKFMRKVSIGYAMYFNIKYQRQGALFGGLFKSKAVADDDLYFKKLFSCIHLNVLDIKFPKWEESTHKEAPKEWRTFLDDYRYSSYKDYLGEIRPENRIIKKDQMLEFFEKDDILTQFIAVARTVLATGK